MHSISKHRCTRVPLLALLPALLPALLLAACGERSLTTAAAPGDGTQLSSALVGSSNVVISQVYGGGGNTGAPYTHDFVELFNRGTSPVSLDGLSIQYASATGTGNFGANSGQLTELPNFTLAPGQYFLVQQGAGAGNGIALPVPDYVDPTPIAMAAGAGKVVLVTGTASLGCNGSTGQPCSAEQLARIIDLVGYGNANFYEGSGAAPTLTNSMAALRKNDGAQDTDNNAADFDEGTPDPRNSSVAPPPPADLVVISQIYGAGGNAGAVLTHDYVELFNRGTTTVSLQDWSLQYASATGTGNFGANSGLLVTLTGSLAPGQYYLVQLAGGSNGAPLPPADREGTIGMAAAAGKVALVTGTSSLGCNGGSNPCSPEQLDRIIDLVGYGNANFFEGSGAAPTISTTLAAFRINGGCTDTDNNAADFATGAPAPRNTASPLNSCAPVGTAPIVSSTTPANGVADVATDANLTVTFSEAVTVTGEWFNIVCTTSGSHTATVSGGSTTFTLDPVSDFAAGEGCTVTIIAAGVESQAAPPVAMAANYSWSFTTAGGDVCELPYTRIYDIQGSGLTTPIPGQVVSTRGVVIGDYEGAQPALRGFYIQDPVGDGDPATSDGIFVFNGTNNSVSLGDVVRVTGTAGEFEDQTQISSVTSIINCGTGSVEPVDISLPFTSATYLERYEGMLVRFPQTLTVTEHFQLGRFGQIVMSSGGRLQQPTNVALPGAPALALQAQNDRNRIIIDDELNSQNPDPIRFGRGGQPLSASNTLRGGDTATGMVGVLTYTWAGNAASGNAYRVRPVNTLGGGVPEFVAANPRPSSPAPVGGTLKVAALNLLNYFNTFSGCSNGIGGTPSTSNCRGANNPEEFERQWRKTVAAILGMNVDVLGIVEIENDGYGPESAIADLVNRLNASAGASTYAFIDADAATGQVNALGTDGIKVGLIYKPASVTPVGATAVLNSVAFVNGGDPAPRNRPSLAQAFRQPDGAGFIVSVNHLKSKGSACTAPDDGDGQGNCNLVRTNAAHQLRSWLASDPTGTGDPDVLIVGDLNAYAMEDPIRLLTENGYTNLIAARVGPNAYSYAFDGQWGYLDHALASASLNAQVSGVTEWHINADEPNVLDYNLEFKSAGQQASLYSPDQYRVSDHDPVIVGLNLTAPYPFGGFLPPLASPPTLNVVKAGQAVPVRFSLGGNRGLNVFASGYPQSVAFPCDAASGGSPLEGTITAGQSSLSYDAATDTYTYIWKTERAWGDSCRELVIRFNDSGPAYRARFRFTR